MAGRIAHGAWALACALLGGCGGGGSGGSVDSSASAGPAASAYGVGNARFQSLDYEAFEGDDRIPELTISADLTGDFSKQASSTIYLIVEDPDELYAITPLRRPVNTATGFQIGLVARGPNTRVGEFRGDLKVNVCLDEACRQPLSGSPLLVPYRLKVLPGIKIVEQGKIELKAKFGDPLPTWRSAVSLPAGSTTFGSAVFQRGFQIGSSTVDVKNEMGGVVLQAQPTHVTSRELDLYVETNATTPLGRKVKLWEIRPITYTVTAPDRPTVVYTPTNVRLTASVASTQSVGGYWQMMSVDAEPFYVGARVEYLNSSNGGMDDANGAPWLSVSDVHAMNNASDLLYPTELRYQVNIQCQRFTPKCGAVPPGSYVAKVIPFTASGQDAPQPLLVRLDMQP